MISKSLKMDDRDKKIFSWLSENPDMSQQEIAKRLKLSQPSINARLKKMKERGILNIDIGMDINKTGLTLARVDFTAKNAPAILNTIKNCPFFVTGMIMSGSHNATAFFVSDSIRKVDEIVSMHLRSNPDINNVHMNVVVESVGTFLLKPNLKEEKNSCCEIGNCKNCPNKPPIR